MLVHSIRRRTCAVALALTLVGAALGPAASAVEPPTGPGPEAAAADVPTDPATEAIDPDAATTEPTAAATEPVDDEPTREPVEATEPAEPTEAAADPAPQTPAAPAFETTPRGGVTRTLGIVSTPRLIVLEDGTPNADGGWDADDSAGNDSGPSNAIVRTQDTVLYRWEYTVDVPGDVALTQTLPESMVWLAESVSSCSEGVAAISADGRTLTCTLTDQPTGQQFYSVRAKVQSGKNGQSVSSTLAVGSATSSAAVTISARPSISIITSGDANYGAAEQDGVVGRYLVFRAAFYTPIDSNKGVRGVEAVDPDDFAVTLDVSDMGPGVALNGACETTLNAYNTTTGQAAGAGSWDCSLNAAEGTVTLRATGVVSDLRTYSPTSPTRAYITGLSLQLWMPSAEYTPGTSLDLQLTGFDPASVSGQPVTTPGQEPGASLITHVNGEKLVLPMDESIRYGFQSVYTPNGSGGFGHAVPGYRASYQHTPLTPGETLFYGGSLRNNSPTLTEYTNATLCATWNEANLNIAGAPTRGTQNSQIAEITGVEYASLPMASDAQRRGVDCGASGDGDAAWSTTIAGAGGAENVNAVRFVIPTLTQQSTVGGPYLGVPMTRTQTPLSTGTPLAVFWQGGSDQTPSEKSTYDPDTLTSSGLGSRAIAAGAVVAVKSMTWEATTAAPGESRELAIQPLVTTATGQDNGPLTAKNVTLDLTLPAGMTVVQNSWLPAPAPSARPLADGSIVYSFPLGDLSSGGSIAPVELRVTADPGMPVPASYTATATIVSPSDPYDAPQSAALSVNALAAFNATQTVDDAAIVPGRPVTSTITLTNALTGSAGPGAVVAVLPFDGDGRGTTGIGDLDLTGLSVAQGDVTVEYTTEAASTVLAATGVDPSGGTGVTWAAWPSDGSVPAGVTAVRLLFTTLDSGDTISVDLTTQADDIAFGAELVSDLNGIVTSSSGQIVLNGAARVELHSGAGRISGTVYRDEDYSWTLDGTETGIADVPVTLTGPSTITVTTDADGRYVADSLVPGTWTVVPDGSALADLIPGQTPEAVELGLAEDATDVNAGFVTALDSPALRDDAVRVATGDTVTVPVLDNDTTTDASVVSAVTQPAAGSVQIAADGRSVRYTAPTGSSQVESFTYTVTDEARLSATATVTATVVAPSAQDATMTIGQTGGSLDLSTLVDGVDLSWGPPSDGAHGETGMGGVGGSTVSYTPDTGFSGTDSFTYSVTDAAGTTVSGTITVTVVSGPVLADDETVTRMGLPVSVEVLDNDPFVGDGTVEITTDPEHGAATLLVTDEIRYTPQAGFLGTDTLVYRVTDSVGQSATATVTIQVVAQVAVAPDSAQTGTGMPVDIDVLTNDPTVGLTLTSTSATSTQGGTAEVLPSGQVHYTPPAVAGTLQDTFTYMATDTWGGTGTATVTVDVYAAPNASTLTVRTGVGQAVSSDVRTLISTDSHPDATGVITTATAHGTLVLSQDGETVTYTPSTGYIGPDSAQITWTDPFGQDGVQQVDITVVAVPTVADFDLRISHTVPAVLDLLDGATGEDLTVTAVQTPAGGTLVHDGTWTYTAKAGFSGADTFTYTVTDPFGQTATGTVTITVEAQLVTPAITARTGTDRVVRIDPAASGVVGTVIAVAPRATRTTTQGTPVLESDGTITFTPAAGFSGTTGFTYTVADALGATAVGQVKVEVLSLTVDAVALDIQGTTRTVIDVLAAVHGSGVTITSVGTAAHGTVEIVNGTVVYTPTAGWAGADTFTVLVTDEFGNTATVTVTATTYASSVLGTDPATPGAAGTTGTQGTATGGGRLAVTGGTAAGLAGIALALLTGGGWLLLTARRRQKDAEEPMEG